MSSLVPKATIGRVVYQLLPASTPGTSASRELGGFVSTRICTGSEGSDVLPARSLTVAVNSCRPSAGTKVLPWPNAHSVEASSFSPADTWCRSSPRCRRR